MCCECITTPTLTYSLDYIPYPHPYSYPVTEPSMIASLGTTVRRPQYTPCKLVAFTAFIVILKSFLVYLHEFYECITRILINL